MNESQDAFTTLTAVDRRHLAELLVAWPTWVRHAPGVLLAPLMVLYDDRAADGIARNELDWLFGEHDRVIAVSVRDVLPKGFPHETVTQRERMLTGLVFAARRIRTEWFLKLDTDTLACDGGDEARFFPIMPSDHVFAAPRWGYTKPGHWLDTLDRWADQVAPGNAKPARHQAGAVAKSRRIISYAMWCRTSFTNECLDLLGDASRLPIPSQDTFLWYCAELLGRPYSRITPDRMPWRHAGGNMNKLERLAREFVS